VSRGTTFRFWFDWIVGTVTVVFGLALALSGAFLMFGYLQPRWLYYLLPAVAVGGIVQVIGGIRMIRCAGDWTD